MKTEIQTIKREALASMHLALKIRKELLLARIDIAEATKKITPEKANELREVLK